MKKLILFLSILFLSTVCVFGQIAKKNLFEYEKANHDILQDRRNLNLVPKSERRLLHFAETRVDKNGEVINTDWLKWEALKQVRKRYKEQQAHLSPAQQRANSGNWDFVGPIYHSDYTGIGRVNRVAFHPTDEDIIYAATAGGGLWYTPNHGIVWYSLTNGIPVQNLTGVAINYNNPNVMYILTGDGDGCCGGAQRYFLGKPSIGLLKSVDGGFTWNTTNLTFDITTTTWANDLKMHPANPDILFVSTTIGLFRTDDGGTTWDTLLTDDIDEIEFKINDPSTVFAVSKDNFYKSTDLGNTFPDTIVIPAVANSGSTRMALATCASNSNFVYLLSANGINIDTSSTSNFRGLFFSNNSGSSFSLVTNTPNLVDYQSGYDLCILCDPADENTIVTGAVAIRKSSDGGSNFGSSGGTHADIHELIVNPLNGRVYAATDGGLYFAEDFDSPWTFMSEWLRITQYYKIAVSQQDENVVIAGAQDNGTHRNENGDAVMDQILGKDGMDCAIHPLNDDLMIASAQDGEFHLSIDGGDSFDSLINVKSLPSAVLSQWVTPVAWDPNNASVIMIGYDPIYKSTDGGTSFSPISDTISGRRILHIGTSNGDRVYASDRYSVPGPDITRLWSSQDGGDEWFPSHLSNTFPDTTMIISGLTTNPDNSAEVWITLAGWTDGEKVYRSMDAGVSWSNMTASLPNVPINCIAYQDTDASPDDAVYIGTDIGVFYRNNNLGDWVYFSNNMPPVEVSDIEVRYVDSKVVIGTYGRGIWESDFFTTCPSNRTIFEIDQYTGLSYFYQATDTVKTNGTLLVDGFGSNVVYRAGERVKLVEGFRAIADNRAVFYALTGGCGDGVPDPD